MLDVTKGFNEAESAEMTLGVCARGYFRTWRGDQALLWQAADHGDRVEFERLIGSGTISTGEYARAHHHATVDFDPTSSMMAVWTTLPLSHKRNRTIGAALFMKVTPVGRTERPVSVGWETVEGLIVRAATGAQARGQVVVVGRGPNPTVDGPSVLLGTSTTNARSSSVISASPAPHGGSWGEAGERAGRATLVASLSTHSRIEAAELTVTALQEWGVEPFDVGIGYVVPIDYLIHAADGVIVGGDE